MYMKNIQHRPYAYLPTYLPTYICTCAHVYIRTYTHSTYLPTYMHICLPTCINTYMHACIPAYIHAHLLAYLHSYTHAYMRKEHTCISCMHTVRRIYTDRHACIPTCIIHTDVHTFTSLCTHTYIHTCACMYMCVQVYKIPQGLDNVMYALQLKC